MEQKLKTVASMSAPHFTVYLDRVRLASGNVSERIRIDHPIASAVLPIAANREIIMVKQYRYALGQESLEIPAGKVDPGESPLECARRELAEETGYQAETLEEVFEFYPAIGYSNEVIKIYMGKDLKKIHEKIDEEEISEVKIIPISEAKEMILNNQIRDSKTVIALALAEKLNW